MPEATFVMRATIAHAGKLWMNVGPLAAHRASLQISFSYGWGSSKPNRREMFEVVTQALQRPENAAEFDWLAIGKKTWKIDAARLCAKYKDIHMPEFAWLGDGVIEVEPEFEVLESDG